MGDQTWSTSGKSGVRGRFIFILEPYRSDPLYDRLNDLLISGKSGTMLPITACSSTGQFDHEGSCGWQRRMLPPGELLAAVPPADEGARGIGLVEGWRGPVLVALSAGSDGYVRRCHPHDPSWQNWPVLEHAIIGNIVPDFPLINKSFNLTYSGHDL